MSKAVNEMSVEELEQELANKKKREQAKREKEYTDYVNHRDNIITASIVNATYIQAHLMKFKTEVALKFEEMQERINAFGKMRTNSKGGFSLTTEDGKHRITRTRSTQPRWGEMATKGIELITKFFQTVGKKRDKELVEVLMSYLEKNKVGELEFSKVFHLIKHEDKFTDPNWKEGLRILKESFNTELTGYGFTFYEKNEATGKWEQIDINFTSIEPDFTINKTAEEVK